MGQVYIVVVTWHCPGKYKGILIHIVVHITTHVIATHRSSLSARVHHCKFTSHRNVVFSSRLWEALDIDSFPEEQTVGRTTKMELCDHGGLGR